MGSQVKNAYTICRRDLGAFSKILLLWQGSVYKLVLPSLCLYFGIFFFISILYRFFFNELQRGYFEDICAFSEFYSSLVPVTFVLAFYVGAIVARWWTQWTKLPWPDNVAFTVNAYCSGLDDEARLIRRNVNRYICLGITMTYRYVSSKVYKRFPTLYHLVEAGMLTEEELKILEKAIDTSEYSFYCFWIPFSWASNLIQEAYKAGKIDDILLCIELQKEINKTKNSCFDIMSYDWVNFPLAYTQVVTIAVYSYFGFALLGRQYLDPSKDIQGRILTVDYVIPVFTILQFIFYFGWLKVAEAIMNPYGEDDDDFDMNWLVDRNLQVGYCIVEDVGQYPPTPVKDIHWEMGIPEELPHTMASWKFRGTMPPTSLHDVKISNKGQEIREPSVDGTDGIPTITIEGEDGGTTPAGSTGLFGSTLNVDPNNPVDPAGVVNRH